MHVWVVEREFAPGIWIIACIDDDPDNDRDTDMQRWMAHAQQREPSVQFRIRKYTPTEN